MFVHGASTRVYIPREKLLLWCLLPMRVLKPLHSEYMHVQLGGVASAGNRTKDRHSWCQRPARRSVESGATACSLEADDFHLLVQCIASTQLSVRQLSRYQSLCLYMFAPLTQNLFLIRRFVNLMTVWGLGFTETQLGYLTILNAIVGCMVSGSDVPHCGINYQLTDRIYQLLGDQSTYMVFLHFFRAILYLKHFYFLQAGGEQLIHFLVHLHSRAAARRYVGTATSVHGYNSVYG